MISRNKKSFRDQIVLDKYFASTFLFAINKQVQRWLRLCETAHNSRTHVNDMILQFKDLINTVLNGIFHMNLSPSFPKVSSSAATSLASSESKPADGKNKGGSKDHKGRKKRKSEDGNGNLVKNTTQPVEFKLAAKESWKDNFVMILPHNQPALAGKIWMCARWHLKGNCYDNCTRAVSQVTNDNIPDNK
jgi:hypothetical protein